VRRSASGLRPARRERHRERLHCGRIRRHRRATGTCAGRRRSSGDGSLGATAAIADALDAEALRRVVVAAHPTHVIHQLTALSKAGPRSARDLIPTNRLRIEGTRHLIAAAVGAGARRLVGGSFALLATRDVPADTQEAADGVRSMESQILEASRSGAIEGVVLRYGLFYGPENPLTKQAIALVRRRMLPMIRGDRGQLPFIHVDDAVSTTVAALDRAPAGSTYDIVDDRAVSMSEFAETLAQAAGARRPFAIPAWLLRLLTPYVARMVALRLPLSNQKARTELGWQPSFPSIREGLT
jgi:nucleoside-diphosphate-sugar epimerase